MTRPRLLVSGVVLSALVALAAPARAEDEDALRARAAAAHARHRIAARDPEGAGRALVEALERDPSEPRVWVAAGDFFRDLRDLARAERCYARALETDPGRTDARAGIAATCVLGREPERAAREAAAALRADPDETLASLALAQALSALGRVPDARAVAEAGLARFPTDPDLWAHLGFLRHKSKDPRGAVAALRAALLCDPEHPDANRSLASYLAAPAPSVLAARALRAAEERLDAGDAVGGLILARRAAGEAPERARLLAAARGSAGDAPGAAAAAREGLEASPEDAEDPQLRFLLGWASRERLESARERVTSLWTVDRGPGTVDSRAASDWPGLGAVFRDLPRLSPDDRALLAGALRPLRRHFPALAEAGVTHTLLPLHRRLTDLAPLRAWRGRPTFDGRCYDGVRGAGGAQAVSGLETLAEARRGGFQTVAHEFAHQVHASLPADLRATIDALYREAVAGGRALDYYARENAFEYFAQGYEAFVSERKRPGVSETAHHVRTELERRDPDLYRLLLRLTEPPEASPGEGR
ncbi:MAG: tetratricopeptide repeat protein [Planctomycetales bacterium]|nr:tetratricopeptide repeat protein [Planctomycetales bacterium]